MSKVICEVCGTAYPEAATQCPICGCVRPVDAHGVPANNEDGVSARKYEHVKGGRFSKSNVRKRTMTSQNGAYAKATKPAPAAPVAPKKKTNSNTGLVVTILVLLLAIIAVVAYIIIKFFVPTSAPNNEVPTEPTVITEAATDPTEETAGDVLCQDLSLDTYEIYLENAGDHTFLTVITSPVDTTEEIIFESEKSSVAMVESDGRVTAVSRGETVITVTCGVVSTQCKVYVGVVKEQLELNRQEITFENPGDTWTVYSGKISLDDIVWSSDDESVATIEDGVVTAVSNGVTTVYGNYEGQIQSCVIRCSFVEDETEAGTPGNADVSSDADSEPTEVTQPAETQPVSSEYKGPFQLKNLIGISSEDVSIKVGETFILALVDSNGKQVKGVEWTVKGSGCTVSGGTVKGVLRSDYCEVVATYNGENYTCIVRVR